jgi:glycosyltransferase involved in cell wall biosynthesis
MESFGMVGLEAMACGCPVVASTAGAIPEVLGGAAAYFDPLDESQLERTLRQVLGDDVMRDGMRERGLARATEFTWEEVCRGMARHFNEILRA